MQRPGESHEPLARLMHYIIWKCHDPTRLGATKLNKVLFYADYLAYVQWGKPITEVSYIKRQFGPVPQPKAFLHARDTLQREGKIAVTQDLYYGKPQTQFVALERPELAGFTPDEISLVDGVIEAICTSHTATSISALSHDLVWQAAEIGEEIPLATVFAGRVGELTETDMVWAQAEARRLGLGQ
jgi:hypothetical protein